MSTHVFGEKPRGTILVPLDGSTRAERALPLAAHLALTTGRELLLVRVLPTVTPFAALGAQDAAVAPDFFQQVVDEEERTASAYLAGVARPLRAEGGTVGTRLLREEAAAALLDTETREGVELVVMTTHGRTGLARFMLGSVADRLVRGGTAPVLLLRSFARQAPHDDLTTPIGAAHGGLTLVALDGSDRAERALDACHLLVGALVQQIVLVRVVSDGADAAQTKAAQDYLADVREHYADAFAIRRCALSTLVLYGEAADQLIAQAEHQADLLVIATHGRSGAARWAFGSVADRVLQGCTTPLLLVHSASMA